MRTSLLPGLIETLRDQPQPQGARVRIFEVGRIFLRARPRLRAAAAPRRPRLRTGRCPSNGARPAATSTSSTSRATSRRWSRRGTLVTRAPRASRAASRALRARSWSTAKRVGWLGELHPRLVREFELPKAPIVFEVDLDVADERPRAGRPSRSRGLPVVRRDLALVVDEDLPAQALLDALEAAKPRPRDRARLFDVYRGPRTDGWSEKPCDSGAYAGYCPYFDGRRDRCDGGIAALGCA